MASGTLVDGGGGDVPRERNRWIENKVYTRKFYRKKPKLESQPPSQDANISSQNHQQQQDVSDHLGDHPLATVPEKSVENGEKSKEGVERPTENGSGSGSGSVQTTESHVNIHLTSMTKEEIREVKQRLVDELEQVRDLLKRVEAKEIEVNGEEDVGVSGDGCRVVNVGVDGSSVVVDGVDGYNHSQLSANGAVADDGVDNGGARSMVSEVNLENGDARKMAPEVSLDNVYSGRMSTEFSLDDGDADPMIPEVSLNNGSGRMAIPEVSLDNGSGRRRISEIAFDNGVTGRLPMGANLHNGGPRRMIPAVNVDSYSGSRMVSEVTSLGKREPPRSLHQLRVSVMENNHSVINEYADKEKRTPKANQFYQNSDFIVGKEKFRPPSKKLKTNGSRKHARAGNRAYGFGLIRHTGQIFKHCSSLLTKLMKHRHGWVFNTPVDVEGLGLHDYFLIIKHPMDLGTVKTNLNANWYRSPREFAEDVRLTFRNAMTYNPEGQDVHIMAKQLSHIFEERWATMEIEYNLDAWYESYPEVGFPTPVKAPLLSSEMGRYIERVDLTPQHTHPKPKAVHYGSSGRSTALKKPKAKDLNKRSMTYEEKQKLSTHLQSLPTEKLDNIVEIIKRRNTSLLQHDNEIEVDIDAVDNETLWELDRFVTNYKKSLSKYKRKAELAMQARQQAERNAQYHTPVAVELSKETKTDEKNTALPQPHQADKQQNNSSRSSSSSSSSSDSSSSSSDSDSDSSSDSDTEQQSPRK